MFFVTIRNLSQQICQPQPVHIAKLVTSFFGQSQTHTTFIKFFFQKATFVASLINRKCTENNLTINSFSFKLQSIQQILIKSVNKPFENPSIRKQKNATFFFEAETFFCRKIQIFTANLSTLVLVFNSNR